MRALAVARQILRNRDIVAAELGFMIFTTVLQGTWVAALVYAFSEGGVGEAGLVAAGVLVPAALLAPFVAVVFDRLDAHHGLAAGWAVQAAVLALIALAIWADWASLIVYCFVALLAVGQMATRPTLSTILPRLAGDPAELVAANSGSGLIENLGFFFGPGAVAVLFLASDNVALPFAVSAVVTGIAVALALAIDGSSDEFEDDAMPDSVLVQVQDGIVLLRHAPGPRRVVVILALGHFVMGALEVAVVAVAIEQLGKGQAVAGLLASAIGVGGVLGGILTFVLVGQRRLSLPFAIGTVVSSAPVMLLAGQESMLIVLVLLATIGLGRPIVYVAGRTLLQSLSADDTLARIFGLLEGCSVFALALGSIGFGQLAVWFGLPVALVATGLVPLVILAFQFGSLRRIDRGRPEVSAHMLALVRRVPIFAPLPAFGLEQMLINMNDAHFTADSVVFHKGTEGALFHVVAEGSAIVELATGDLVVEPGGFFGEVALISDQPRNATVRAGDSGLRTYTLERDIFLTAISAAGRSWSRSNQIAQRRLG